MAKRDERRLPPSMPPSHDEGQQTRELDSETRQTHRAPNYIVEMALPTVRRGQA